MAFLSPAGTGLFLLLLRDVEIDISSGIVAARRFPSHVVPHRSRSERNQAISRKLALFVHPLLQKLVSGIQESHRAERLGRSRYRNPARTKGRSIRA